MKFNQEKIEQAVKMIFEAIGENPNREGLINTPRRIGQMYQEILSGLHEDISDKITIYSEDKHQEMVVVKDITFHSMCEHHLLPFFGTVKVAYIPDSKILGISKIAKITEHFSKRLQLQERLTSQIADNIMDFVQPQGVMIIIEAEHLCLSMRGIKKPGTSIVTSAVRGLFDSDSKTRNEALELFK